MKKPLSIACCIILSFVLTSCFGYNSIMYDPLSNPHNYLIYSAKIMNIHYYNSKDNQGIVTDNNRMDLVKSRLDFFVYKMIIKLVYNFKIFNENKTTVYDDYMTFVLLHR